MKNVFAKFAGVKEKKAKIKALDGAEVTYRELTMVESDGFNRRMVKEYDSDGKPVFDFNAATEIKYEKVALALIDPKVTVDELKAMSSDAATAIVEIMNLIDDTDENDGKEVKNSAKKK